MALILISENASSVVKPVRAIDAAGAKGRSAPFVSCLTRCSVIPGPNSTGRRKRHLHPSFCPEIQFPLLLRAPGPIPVSRPQARPVLEGVCSSLTLQHPACADLNTAGRSKPSALDPGNVSIISSYFSPPVSTHLLPIRAFLTVLGLLATAWPETQTRTPLTVPPSAFFLGLRLLVKIVILHFLPHLVGLQLYSLSQVCSAETSHSSAAGFSPVSCPKTPMMPPENPQALRHYQAPTRPWALQAMYIVP
jgi:hypothetical protein